MRPRLATVIGSTGLFLGALALGPDAQAEGRFGAHDIQTLFVIGKNTDKNEVQFGIHLDKDCSPLGDEPIYAYWRQYEKGPEVTEDLNFLDKTGYGIKSQKVEKRTPTGGKVNLVLKATPERGIGIFVHKEGSSCVAEPLAFISGVTARLERIHVQLKSFLSIDYIEIRGKRVDDKQAIVERAKP
jgi:hypothetical protein